ncbi:GAF domain-containing protein [Halococcoides cellulosivorans]|uniref:GAF domain-containing protein n=1 Tax=Halococcoides cellulosivorans TaxID=1679096 RepID=UPI00131EF9DA|nr:GAF domain-containing protein [Halococcoides cellulosivorans]
MLSPDSSRAGEISDLVESTATIVETGADPETGLSAERVDAAVVDCPADDHCSTIDSVGAVPVLAIVHDGGASAAIDAGATAVLDWTDPDRDDLFAHRLDRCLDRARDRSDGPDGPPGPGRRTDLYELSHRLLDVGAWEYDVSDRRVHWTDQKYRLHGRTDDENPSFEEALDTFHTADRHRIERALEWATEQGVGFDLQARIESEETDRWVRTVGEPVESDGTVTHVRGAIQDVSSVVDRETEIERNEEALRAVNEAVTDLHQPFEETIERLLDIGRERLGLDVGFVADVGESTVEVRHLSGDAAFERGSRLPIDATFCRNVESSGGVVAIHDVGALGLGDDPAVEATGLEAYVGAPVVLQGHLWGTVCFGSPVARDRPVSERERSFARLLGQEIGYLLSQRHQRDRLVALYDVSRSLFDAEDVGDVPRRIISALESIRDGPSVVVYRWDESAGALFRAARTGIECGMADPPARIGSGSDPVWEGFLASENRTAAAGVRGSPWIDDDCIQIVVPIAGFGAIVSVRPASFAPIAFEETLLNTLVRHVDRAIEIASLRDSFQRTTADLDRAHDRLDRIERIETVIRDVLEAILGASTRRAIESAVVDRLSAVEDWSAAVVDRDPESGDLACHGDSAVGADLAGGPPCQRAIEDDTVVVTSTVLDADGPHDWRQGVIEAGYQSIACVPLTHENSRRGVLEVYGRRPNQFHADEQAMLTDLGHVVAYAIDCVERRRAFRSGGRVELSVAVAGDPLFDRLIDREISLSTVVERPSGGYRLIGRTDDPETALDEWDLPMVDRVTHLGSGEGTDDGSNIELVVDSSPLLDVCRDHDVAIAGFDPIGKQVAISLHVPSADRIETVIDALADRLADVDVLAQRSDVQRDPPDHLLADLTDRQREVLAIAYSRGYFEWPREASGEQVAEDLQIAGPTFHQHLRQALGTVLDAVFDDGVSSPDESGT